MRRLLYATTAILLALGLAGAAQAAKLQYSGTIGSKLGAGQLKKNRNTSTGVATVNLSGGGGLLHTISFPGSRTGSNFNPVTDPDTTGTIKTIGREATAVLGTFADLQNPPLTQNKMLIKGFSRLCLFQPCGQPGSFNFDIPLSANNGNTAVGIGGTLYKGGFGEIRISLEAAPWTLGSATAVNQTGKGNFKTVTVSGFIHGAASGTGGGGSTAQVGGLIQLISPAQVTAIGTGDNNSKQSNFAIFTVHFIPEPGLLLLLGAGVVGLGILGRSRMHR